MTTLSHLRALRTRGVGLPACREHLALMQRIAERHSRRLGLDAEPIPARVASGEPAARDEGDECGQRSVSPEVARAVGSLSSFDGCESGCSGPVVVDVPARLCARCAAEMLQ